MTKYKVLFQQSERYIKTIENQQQSITNFNKDKGKPHIVSGLFNKSTTNKVAFLKLIVELRGRAKQAYPTVLWSLIQHQKHLVHTCTEILTVLIRRVLDCD